MRVCVLAGGTGGAKLAAGMQALAGPELSVIANTADDIETLGVHVSPDPDLITYWLTGEIDEDRGWGIRGDSFTAFERLVRLGAPDWFALSDRDLATCLYRRQFIAEGGRLTDVQLQIARALGARAQVLPMCDEPVRTRVRTTAGWRTMQEYLILDRAAPAIEQIELEGIEQARATPEVLDALARSELIVIGPSNPVISIGPILSVPEIREAIGEASSPVIAVSPFVAGEVIKGPTELFMRAVGRQSTAAGVCSLYEGLLDGMLVDEGDPDSPPVNLPTISTSVLMEGGEGRARVARAVVEFATSLTRR